MSVLSFKNKVVVVTGAASGIGAAICHRFGRAGSKLGLLDLDEGGLEVMAAQLEGAGIDSVVVKCDVVDEGQCHAAIRKVSECYGGIDVLVNNAGITQRSAFVHTKISVYRQVMDVNFFGSVNCTRAAISSLIERKGTIIVIESLAGLTPLLGRTGYCASKHALHGFFTSLRSELRESGIQIMIVCPGFVDTNLQTRALGGDGQITTHPQSMVGKAAPAEKVAEDIYKGAQKKRNLLVLTPVGKMAYWLNRIAPATYERLMAGKVKAELME